MKSQLSWNEFEKKKRINKTKINKGKQRARLMIIMDMN